MSENGSNSRQVFLQKIRTQARIEEILYSKAWVNTQRTLKRSGLICVKEQEDGKFEYGQGTFSFHTVRYLYMLHTAAGLINQHKHFPGKVEVAKLYGFSSNIIPPYIIVPLSVRRKAEGFRQMTEKQITDNVDKEPEFSGSLYALLCDVYKKDMEKLNKMIIDLPVTREEIHAAPELSIDIYRKVHSQYVTVFRLFCYECRRLGYFHDLEQPMKAMIRIINSEETEKFHKLSCALFFMLMYWDKDDSLSSFFYWLFIPEAKNFHSKYMNKKTDDFIALVYKKYLSPATKRRKKK
ncbi:hypothetical protein F384_13055 [Citrobacter amalonaticus Y19]|uniref:Uncharacterized protein n=1 Tax=Citrobacter amalonaticus Y19 TaxID=1261127 RepID=A0A0F6TVY3_CITAM|nr:hypothetical protein [Citrobacter amalonaticus]AKE59419.1 hypothetical protein F384_13055 [Citrobacter amalonaticus Y19]